MWLAASSGIIAGGGPAMARLAPEQRCPMDVTDAQWALVEPEFTTHAGPGAPTRVDLRQMVNGIL